jgi:hypothetical protein
MKERWRSLAVVKLLKCEHQQLQRLQQPQQLQTAQRENDRRS